MEKSDLDRLIQHAISSFVSTQLQLERQRRQSKIKTMLAYALVHDCNNLLKSAMVEIEEELQRFHNETGETNKS